jgi:hypothetical protein
MLSSSLRLSIVALVIVPLVLALGDDQCILFPKPHLQPSWFTSPKLALQTIFSRSTDAPSDHFIIADSTAHHHYAPSLILDSKDDEAIHIAAHSFVGDIERVTGVRIKVFNDKLPRGVQGKAILVGSVDSGLIKGEKPDWTEEMRGRWEVWDARVVKSRHHGVDEALILTGSDRVSGVIHTSKGECMLI